MQLLLLAPLGVWFAFALGQEPASVAPEPEVAPPRDVTLATRADPEALAALQTPGVVLFRDDFESPTAFERYFEVRGAKEGHAARVTDAGVAHGGEAALRLTSSAADGRSTGAGVSGWLGDEGHERVHLRYWLRFAEDYDQGNLNHTGGGLAGVVGAGKWDGMGTAGLLPNGADRFSARFETWREWGRRDAPGGLALYTYWMDMRRDKDGNYWGNLLQPPAERRVVPERGRWVCYELMLAVNSIGAADGELAAWVDGELYLYLEGLRWRTDERLKLKRFGLDVYVHQAHQANTVWFDDVVVSTGYVGPK